MKKENYLDLDDPRLKQRYEFPNAPLSTDTFRVPPSTAARRGMVLWARRFWFVCAVPVVALIVLGGIYDWRWLVVGLLIALVVYPGLLVLGWHSVLSRPSAIVSYFPHRVDLATNGDLTVTYFPLPPPKEDAPEPSQKKSDLDKIAEDIETDVDHPPTLQQEVKAIAEHDLDPDVPTRYKARVKAKVEAEVLHGMTTGTHRYPLPLHIPAADVTSARRWGRYVVLTYGPRNELFIPVASMPPDMEAYLLEMEPYIM